MIKYSRYDPFNEDWSRSSKSKISNSRSHFKNTRETANAIKNMSLKRASYYLYNVLKKKEIVPFRVHTGGVGRHSQAKNIIKKKSKGGRPSSQGRWPHKSCHVLLNLLKNAESNAYSKGLNKKKMFVNHIAVQRAGKIRRRVYRAHGRINPFVSNPCHVELFLEETK